MYEAGCHKDQFRRRAKMSLVRRNIAFNFAGRAWTVVLSFALVPLYLKFLGIEAYALIGFFATLQGLCGLLDFGMSAALTRELARCSVSPGTNQKARDLARSLETIYWGMAAIIALVLSTLSPFIARHWVNPERLDAGTVQHAILIMALTVSIQWPLSLYNGGLIGLQRQALNNIVTILFSTLRGVGSLLVLWLISPTIDAYFQWQISISILQTASLALLFWRIMPKAEGRAQFRWSAVRDVWRFAAGISAISIILLLLSQVDKVILSKVLTLEHFGYYMLANTLASAVALAPAPVSDALFPRYVQLLSQRNEEELKKMFHIGCQVIACLVFSTAAVIIFFSKDIVMLWTGNPLIAAIIHPVVSVLALGFALNYGVMSTTDALQMVHGWLKPAIYSRLAALFVIGPCMVYMAMRYQALGAALTWLVIYSCFSLITPHVVFHRLLKGEKARWYFDDILKHVLIAFITVLAFRWILPIPTQKFYIASYFLCALLLAVLAGSLANPYSRYLLKKAFVFAKSGFIGNATDR